MSISNFSNYIVISGKGIAIFKVILVLPSTSQVLINVAKKHQTHTVMNVAACIKKEWYVLRKLMH